MCSSYSRLLAFEAARILFRLGCDVRVYNPTGLPVKDDTQHSHPKVQELRDLSRWSDGHIWVSPEQHGNLVRLYLHHPTILDWLTSHPDRCLQKPNRLDPPLHRLRPSNPRPHSRHCPGIRRLAIFQHGQFSAYAWPLDAHVHRP